MSKIIIDVGAVGVTLGLSAVSGVLLGIGAGAGCICGAGAVIFGGAVLLTGDRLNLDKRVKIISALAAAILGGTAAFMLFYQNLNFTAALLLGVKTLAVTAGLAIGAYLVVYAIEAIWNKIQTNRQFFTLST